MYTDAREVNHAVDIVEKLIGLLIILQAFTITSLFILSPKSGPNQEFCTVILDMLKLSRQEIGELKAEAEAMRALVHELRACVAALTCAGVPRLGG